MRIEIDNKSWYDITDFDSYEEIEELGEVTGTSVIPDCIDLERRVGIYPRSLAKLDYLAYRLAGRVGLRVVLRLL